MIYTYHKNELYHHGILGMHWGIRRYQNKDGTLTAEGVRRRINTYNYKNSSSYKNATKADKRKQDFKYSVNRLVKGRKKANSEEYHVREESKEYSKTNAKDIIRATAAASSTAAILATGKTLVVDMLKMDVRKFSSADEFAGAVASKAIVNAGKAITIAEIAALASVGSMMLYEHTKNSNKKGEK